MAAESSRKVSINLSKTSIVFGLVLLALGYFIGNTLPIANDDFRLRPENPIMTSTVGQGE